MVRLEKRLKIRAFNGEYELFETKRLKIEMYCNYCKKWVTPDRLELGKAHVYGLHCGVLQDIGCTFFKER